MVLLPWVTSWYKCSELVQIRPLVGSLSSKGVAPSSCRNKLPSSTSFLATAATHATVSTLSASTNPHTQIPTATLTLLYGYTVAQTPADHSALWLLTVWQGGFPAYMQPKPHTTQQCSAEASATKKHTPPPPPRPPLVSSGTTRQDFGDAPLSLVAQPSKSECHSLPSSFQSC